MDPRRTHPLPNYNPPRSHRVQGSVPARNPRGQTTLPSSLEAGREGEPPTPQMEHGGMGSFPQVTQPPRNVLMSASRGSPSHEMTINVPFNRHGGFADVWKCIFDRRGNSRGELVAVKCIRLKNEQDKERVIRRLQGEVYLWMKLTPHRHVLPLYGTVNGFEHLPALVSPWAENGTLTSYVDRSRRHLSHDRELKIILQVTSGLHHLHSNNICHGDLTGSNILINSNGDALISDFGLSSIVAEFNHTSYFQSCRPGAIRWVDPQLIIDLMNTNDGPLPRIHMINDIYSMGCIMLEVATGSIPYHGTNDWAVQLAKYRWENPVIPHTVSPILANLMVGCWDKDYSRRPRVDVMEEAIREGLNSLQM